MAKRAHKIGAGASELVRKREQLAIIPGLGVDVPELRAHILETQPV